MTATTLLGPGRPKPTGSRPSRAARVAYLSYSTAEFDGRTHRMARSAMVAGYEVVVYARTGPGLPPVEHRDGYRIVRVPDDWRAAIPWLRSRSTDRDPDDAVAPPQRSLARRVRGRLIRPIRRRWKLVQKYPLRPLGWAATLDAVAEPADIWHGMWAGSLPALDRLARRHGGRTIYDSRDVYMRSREFAHEGGVLKALLAGAERRWARRATCVITVNDGYADMLVEQLGVERPPIVMNRPARWEPSDPRPDLIREAIGLPAQNRIVLYQGQLIADRGIEPCMDAILDLPGAVLVLMGYGASRDRLVRESEHPPFRGRVFVLPPVAPDALLAWTASADVSVMAIQPTSDNHAMTTPQKLFESVAAGVPVVAADLPGMASIVRGDGVGQVCDPTSPSSIATALREILDLDVADGAALRQHVLDVAHERYHWEGQEAVLLELYQTLAPAVVPASADASALTTG